MYADNRLEKRDDNSIIILCCALIIISSTRFIALVFTNGHVIYIFCAKCSQSVSSTNQIYVYISDVRFMRIESRCRKKKRIILFAILKIQISIYSILYRAYAIYIIPPSILIIFIYIREIIKKLHLHVLFSRWLLLSQANTA